MIVFHLGKYYYYIKLSVNCVKCVLIKVYNNYDDFREKLMLIIIIIFWFFVLYLGLTADLNIFKLDHRQ